MRTPVVVTETKAAQTAMKTTRKRPPYLFLVPFFLFYCLFWVVPLIAGLNLSMRDSVSGEFIGLANYARVLSLSNTSFWRALYNTSYYLVGTLITIIPAALALALLLRNAYSRLQGLIRFLLFVPALMPPIVMGLLFVYLFSGRYGLLNNVLLAPFGSPNLDWLKDPKLIKPALIILGIWRWTGFVTMFIWAGLDGIPQAYYDAARTEGANRFQIFRYVTVPLLRPILLFAALFLVFDAFVLFSGAHAILGTGGGALESGLLIVNLIYRTAFYGAGGNFGVATAISYIIVPILVAAVWLFLRLKSSED